MHPIMQALHEDHVNVARLLELIEEALHHTSRGDLSRLDLAHQAMRYMTAYPDIYHHPTEDIVFAALVRRAPETRQIVDQLSAEHELLGSSGTQFLSLLTEARAGIPESLPATGAAYVDTLRAHMNIEEGRVFPIIKVVFGHHDWDTLNEQLEIARDPLFGPQLKSSYQQLARALTDR
ncbi:MAG: hemerythrin domain-containing protein [Gammaproteobacteria bacterium]|nr:hemerythrin domain-containing protein [Gammaproteobacteria bacterium]NNF60525.1 hypothetical protein [Gammaproteobacteria bacterium]NNM20293.1 hypothetical protein [Gammaproteobacteria bacterium]